MTRISAVAISGNRLTGLSLSNFAARHLCGAGTGSAFLAHGRGDQPRRQLAAAIHGRPGAEREPGRLDIQRNADLSPVSGEFDHWLRSAQIGVEDGDGVAGEWRAIGPRAWYD